MSIPECGKRDTCKNYGKECNSCWQRSDIYNTHPCYKSKDLVEVVRCKDCRYCVDERCECYQWIDANYEQFVREDGFCSYGERKGEGDG